MDRMCCNCTYWNTEFLDKEPDNLAYIENYGFQHNKCMGDVGKHGYCQYDPPVKRHIEKTQHVIGNRVFGYERIFTDGRVIHKPVITKGSEWCGKFKPREDK